MKQWFSQIHFLVLSGLRAVRRSLFRAGPVALGIAVATGFAASASWMYYMADAALGEDARASLGADAVWSVGAQAISPAELRSALHRSEITAWSPALFGRSAIRSAQRTSLIVVKGIEPEEYPYYGRTRLLGPDGTLRSGEVALTRNAADRLGVNVGDTVELLSGGQNHTFRVKNLVSLYSEHATDSNVFGVAYLRLEQAREVLGATADDVSEVAIKAVDPAAVKQTLEALVAEHPRSRSYTAAEEQRSMRAQVSTLMLYVHLFGVAAVLIAGIGISSLMAVLVQDRVKEIATLKAVGLRPAQVTLMVMIEGGIIGGLGVILGLVLAAALAGAARSSVGHYLQLDLRFQFLPQPLVVGLVGGLGSALAATWLPALQAARVPSALAWQEGRAVTMKAGNTVWEQLGVLVCLGVGLGLYMDRLLHEAGLAATVLHSVLIGLAVVLVGAGFLALLRQMVARLLARIGRWKRKAQQSVFLALHALAGSPGRAALTCICIVLSVVTVGLSGMLGDTVKDGLERQLSVQTGGNVIVTAPPLSDANVKAALALVTDVGSVVRTTNVSVVLELVNGKPLLDGQGALPDEGPSYLTASAFSLQGVDLAGNMPQYRVSEGRDLTAEDDGKPVLLMLDSLARARGIHPGDNVTLRLGDHRQTYVVVGLMEGELVKTALMRSPLTSLGSAPVQSVTYSLRLPAGEVATALSTLNRALPQGAYALSLDDNLLAMTQILNFQRVVLGFISLLSLVTAGLLILTEVVTAIARQQRELATMKVLGITPASLVRALSVQYAIVGVVGGTIGAILSVGLTAMVAGSILKSSVRVPSSVVVVPFVVALFSAAVATAAALPGMNRRPSEALRA